MMPRPQEKEYHFPMVKPVFTMGLSQDAKQLREEIFVQEQGFQNEFGPEDDRSWSLVLYLDDLPIATGRILEIDPETYQIGRVAVKKELRGKTVGSTVLKFLATKARTLGARKIVLNAQLDKLPFYEKAGFAVSSDGLINFDEGKPHVWMEKILVRPNKKRKGF